MLKRLILFHLASGQALFSGAAFLFTAVVLSPVAKNRWLSVLRNLLVGLGVTLIALSATPLPPFFYVVYLASILLWIAGEAWQARLSGRLLLILRSLVVLACVVSVCLEAPYHVIPQLPAMGQPTLGVIGDSITAGLGDPGVMRWPKRLAHEHQVVVRDHAEVGATVASALEQAEALTTQERLVLLEIGGNDLLGGTTPVAFEAGLERLLRSVCRPGRVVLMLELPLPPGYNRFGHIQRRLARRYGVFLIPRRILLSVLLDEDATVDSIHLSELGQSRLADLLWSILRGAYSAREKPLTDRDSGETR